MIPFPALSCRTKERPRNRLRRARPHEFPRSLQADRRLPSSFIPLGSPAGFFPLLVRRSGKTILSILSEKNIGQDLQDPQDSFSWSLLPDERETEKPPAAGKASRVPPEPTSRSPTPKLFYSTAIAGWLLSASRPEKRKNHPVNPVRKNIGHGPDRSTGTLLLSPWRKHYNSHRPCRF